MKDFFIQNWDTILSILGGFFAFLWGIIQFFKTQKQQIEIEKLKTQLELQKTQLIQNDKKFREAYEGFIALMFDILHNKSKKVNIEEGIIEFMKKTLLFAGPKTLKAFSMYRKQAGIPGEKDILLYTEDLIFSMREDLGVSNKTLKQYDILQTFIVGDVEKEINKQRTNT